MIAVVLPILLAVVSVVGFRIYEQQKMEREYNRYKAKLEELEEKFGEDTERSEKIEVLKTVINDAEEYKDTDKPDERIIQEYDITTKAMRAYFMKGYDAVIEENRYSSENPVHGAETYEEEIENLSDELKIIEEEKGIVATEEEVETYKEKIESSISKYEEMAKENAEYHASVMREQEEQAETQITKEEAFQLIIDNIEFNDEESKDGWEETPREYLYDSNANWGWCYFVQDTANSAEATVIDNDTIHVVVTVEMGRWGAEKVGEYTLKRERNSSAGQQVNQGSTDWKHISYNAIVASKDAKEYYVDSPPRAIPILPTDGHVYKLQFEDTKMKVWGRLSYTIPETGEQGVVEAKGLEFKIDEHSVLQNGIESLKRSYNGKSDGEGGGTALFFEVQGDTIISLGEAG